VGYYFLLALLTLATFFIVVCVSSVCVHLAWPRIAAPLAQMLPRSRARTLLLVRAIPSLGGAVAAVVAAAGFLEFEPAWTSERPGVVLIAAAAAALGLVALVAFSALRALALAIRCSRLMRHCPQLSRNGRTVCVVDSPYPVAAVTGLFRARLVLSDLLLRECAADELEVILAHEAAHVSRSDNFVRALMLAMPDPLRLMASGRAIEAAWAAAAEEAADDDAAGETVERRVALASALVRVAALARTPPPPWMPALAFFQGDNLERRVRRLVEPQSAAVTSLRVVEPSAVMVIAAIVTWGTFQAGALHALMEWAIRTLP
jgi:beta-lactamase regulating signal transducer with metallopeptidase domain